jgi:hypothetical protein
MKSESGETTMAVVKVEEVSVESLLAHITHIDVDYALWCLKSRDQELIKEGKRQLAQLRKNTRHLIAFIDAACRNSVVEDLNLANDVRRAALLAAGSLAPEDAAAAYREMIVLFSDLMRPTQPFIAQFAFKAL